MPKATPRHEPADHTRQLPRLRRIEGQVRGLQQMIKNERPCLEVVNQAGAIVSSLRRVQGDMLRDHLAANARMSASRNLSQADRQKLADEVASLLKSLR